MIRNQHYIIKYFALRRLILGYIKVTQANCRNVRILSTLKQFLNHSLHSWWQSMLYFMNHGLDVYVYLSVVVGGDIDIQISSL